ncbi:MAG: FliA/WhiG family RNA polymerase sigma factor [Pseudomonadota bacterium]|nr:FliA/WhiG family RNA polymerase sigma factor [Pseudomonadota bacterium]
MLSTSTGHASNGMNLAFLGAAPSGDQASSRLPLSGARAPTPSARERLILEHRGMVRAIAGRMARRLPAHVDGDELVTVGMLGLIDAIDRFEAGRGVPFRAYAEIRIRGAIVDSLRGSDWTPRAVRRSSGRIEATRTQLRETLGRDPSRDEMATSLEVAPAAYDRLCARSVCRRLVSLDAPTGEDGDALLVDLVADEDAATTLDRWETAERHSGLTDAVEQLSERERLVVTAYYQHGTPLKEIGATLGVTESRVCQIHGQALKRLQRLLREDAE